ncbi:MAG: DUF6263 family protein [Prevotellaceae bacterium]|jgi:hypothetical protein|nr:DUF6263 family protein [Prevotellaceae bacterium]
MKYLILKVSTLNLMLMMVLFSCGDSEKFIMEYNLKQGEILKQNIVTNMDLVQKIGEEEIKMSLTMEMKMAFEVKDCQNDACTVEIKFKEMKTTVGIAGKSMISFDSNTSGDFATATDLGPMFKAIIDKPFETVMTKTGKVLSIKGLDKFAEAMLGSFGDDVPENIRQQMIGQFGLQFSEDALKSQLEQNTGYFSGKPVGIGDSWNSKSTSKLSNFMIAIDVKNTIKSVEDNIVNVNIEGTVATPDNIEQDVNGMKAKVSLKGSQKGVVKIDKNTGWIVSSNLSMNFNGEIEVGGMKVPVFAASTITVTDK